MRRVLKAVIRRISSIFGQKSQGEYRFVFREDELKALKANHGLQGISDGAAVQMCFDEALRDRRLSRRNFQRNS